MSDILLLNPPFTSLGYKTTGSFASRSFPLGLGLLSGALKARKFSFSVIDADAVDMSIDELLAGVIRENPRIIGISTYTSYSGMIAYIVKEIRRSLKNCVIVLGGHHAFALKGKLLNETLADIIAIGEGETLFPNLCHAILNDMPLESVCGIYFKRKGEIFYTGDNEQIKDLDTISMPAYEFFPMNMYRGHFYRGWIAGYRKPFTNLVTSRGCPFSCSFCSNVMWGKKVRFQSPERVIAEIDFLVEKYGIRQLSFFDDTFTMDMARARKICDLLIDRNYKLDIYCSTRVDLITEELIKKMARAGFKWIGIGIESGDDRILKKIAKHQSVEKCSEALKMIADNRIAIYGSAILGYPGEDKHTLNSTLSFVLKNPVHLPQFSIFVPYPGTPVYEELVKKGVDIPADVGQYNRVFSYNEGITARYLIFFQFYSHLRSFLDLRHINLMKKMFRLSIVFSDLIKIAWAMLWLNRGKSEWYNRRARG